MSNQFIKNRQHLDTQLSIYQTIDPILIKNNGNSKTMRIQETIIKVCRLQMQNIEDAWVFYWGSVPVQKSSDFLPIKC